MEVDRRRYIEQGLMADPDKPTTLDHAITPVGTCTEMCPENERVDRMYEMQFELAESVRAGHVYCPARQLTVAGSFSDQWQESTDREQDGQKIQTSCGRY